MSVAPAMAPPSSLPPPLSSGAPPGAPPPTAQPFHSALAEEWARTAPAEGQQNDSRQADAAARSKQEKGAHRHAGKASDAQQASSEALDAEGPASGEAPRETASAAIARSSITALAPGEGTPRMAGKASPEGVPAQKPPSGGSGAAAALSDGTEAVAQHQSSLDGARVPLAGVLPSVADAADEGVSERVSSGAVKTSAQSEAARSDDVPVAASEGPQAGPRVPVAVAGTAASTAGSSESSASTADSSESSVSTKTSTSGEAQSSSPTSTDTQSGYDPAGPSRTAPLSEQPSTATTTSPGASAASPEAAAPALASSSRETSARVIRGVSTRGHSSAQVSAAAARQAGVPSSATQPLELAVGGSQPAELARAVEGGPLLGAGVDLEEMIDSIHATIELAARQGMSQARIALQPAELGQIRIHLSQTSEGLLARVTADTPAAAQALNASRSELHQSLSSLGSTLLRLDIGSFNQPEGRDAASSAGTGFSGRGRTTEGESSIEQIDEPDGSGPAQRLPLGGLVDVLA